MDRDPVALSSASFRALAEVARSVHASLDLTDTLATIAREVTVASGFAVAAVNLVRPDGSFEVVAVEGGPEIQAALLGTTGTAQQWQALLSQTRPWGELLFIHHDDVIARDDSLPSWRPDLAVSDDPGMWHPDDSLLAPLTSGTGELLGLLSVDLPHNGRLPDSQQREMLTLFAHHASIAVQHALIHQELQARRDELHHVATHDHLTGLSNRLVLRDQAPARAAAPGNRIAVLVIDLDHFKQFNDEAGHLVGDELLAELAHRMQDCVRDDDLLARTGGDEFVVVLRGPGELPVHEVVARLAEAIGAPVQVGDRICRVGVSIGVAQADTPTDFDRLLAAADADMYRRKQANRTALTRS